MVDLMGKKFKIVTNNLHPFIFLEKTPIEGTEAKILLTMSKVFNFTYVLNDFNFDFGKKLENNSWTGLIGSIVSKESDFGIFDLYLNYERSIALNYTYPYFIDLVTFTSPLPTIKANKVNLTEPFDIFTWLLITMITLLILIISLIFFKQENRVFWIIVSIFMKQQIYMHSEIRNLLFTLLLAGIVLTSSYAGIFYSMLISFVEENRIETLQDLSMALKSNKIIVIGLNNGIYFNMIKETKSGVIGEIGSRIRGVHNISTAVNLLRKPKAYAFVLAKELLCYAIHRNKLISHYIPDNSNMDSIFAINFVSILMNRDFPYQKQFNRFISQAFKGGLFDYWRRTFYYKIFGKDMNYFNKYMTLEHKLTPISNDQFYSIYMILAIAYSLSALIYIAEILFKNN